MLDKLKKNNVLKIIGNAIYTIAFIIVVLMLIVVLMQRFTNNSIAFGGIRMFTVATESMVPKYQVGDILISKEVKPSKLKVDDDIVYIGEQGSFAERIITHRIVSIESTGKENYKIVTKGIANNVEDPEIDQTRVLGKVVWESKLLTFLGKLVRNMYVFYILIFIPIIMFIVRKVKELKEVEAEITEEEKDKTNESENNQK